MSKLVIIGSAGNVGHASAIHCINEHIFNDVACIDMNEKKNNAVVMDMQDMDSGTNVYVGTYKDCQDADIIAISAGKAQTPGSGETRLDTASINSKIVTSIVENIRMSISMTEFKGKFIILTNPVDVMTTIVQRLTNLPTERVIGSGTVLDSDRIRKQIATKLNVDRKQVHVYVVGEHGDSQSVLWEEANVAGTLLTSLLSPSEREELAKCTEQRAYNIIDGKGCTDDAIGMAFAKICKAIMRDTKTILPVGMVDVDTNNVCINFPRMLDKDGVHKLPFEYRVAKHEWETVLASSANIATYVKAYEEEEKAEYERKRAEVLAEREAAKEKTDVLVSKKVTDDETK